MRSGMYYNCRWLEGDSALGDGNCKWFTALEGDKFIKLTTNMVAHSPFVTPSGFVLETTTDVSRIFHSRFMILCILLTERNSYSTTEKVVPAYEFLVLRVSVDIELEFCGRLNQIVCVYEENFSSFIHNDAKHSTDSGRCSLWPVLFISQVINTHMFVIRIERW